MQKSDEYWRIIVHYSHFNQVVIPIEAAVPDVVLLFEQINRSPDTQYAAIDLVSVFSRIPAHSPTRNSLLSAGKASNIPPLSFLRDISILLP